jgi:integrase
MSAHAINRCKELGCKAGKKRCGNMKHWYIEGFDRVTKLTTKRSPVSDFAGVWANLRSDMGDKGRKLPEAPETPGHVKDLLAPAVSACLSRGENPKAVGRRLTVGDATTMNVIFDSFITSKHRDARRHGETFHESKTFKSSVSTARAYFGDMVPTLMTGAVIDGFIESFIDRGCMAASANDVLNRFVSPACQWAAAQKPSLMVNPFGKYGEYEIRVMFNEREKRIEPAVEASLRAGCAAWEAQWLDDAIVLAIDLFSREGELLKLTNADVDWKHHTVTLYKTKRRRRRRDGKKSTEGETRVVPFNPFGRVAKILRRRKDAGPSAYVIDVPCGSRDGSAWGTRVQILSKAWVNLVLKTLGGLARTRGMATPKKGTPEHVLYHETLDLHFHDLRHEAITWMAEHGVSPESRKFLDGHASQRDSDGRYNHGKARVALTELREKVWPVEDRRGTPAKWFQLGSSEATGT